MEDIEDYLLESVMNLEFTAPAMLSKHINIDRTKLKYSAPQGVIEMIQRAYTRKYNTHHITWIRFEIRGIEFVPSHRMEITLFHATGIMMDPELFVCVDLNELFSKKKIIKLQHPEGHPYWQKNKFRVFDPEGGEINCWCRSSYGGKNGEEYEIEVDDDGIFVQYFMCSSGLGKNPHGERHLLIAREDIDGIEYVGDPLVISDKLENEVESIYKKR